LAYTLSGKLKQVLKYNEKEFEGLGILKDGFLNLNNMFALQLGAIGEIYKVLDVVCGKLGLSYSELKNLIRK
jgi:hypothetical protein